MKLLIDSSTNYLFLGIYDNGKINSYSRTGKNDHSETLVDYLNKFLVDSGYCVDDITEVYVGRGPGSYTGLRIAGTVGKVLADIKKIEFYSFSSLDFVLAGKLNINGKYLVRIDAKKNNSYYKVVEVNKSAIEIICDEKFGSNDEFNEYDGYSIIEPDEELVANLDTVIKNIIENNLYQEEDVLEYSPNYIRSGI